MTESKTRRKVFVGKVVSNKMEKTVSVEVTRKSPHPLYGRYVMRRSKFLAHDEKKCQIGDVVEIMETRPLSRRKRWRVVKILERAS